MTQPRAADLTPSGWEILVRRREGKRWEPLTPENSTKDGHSWPPEHPDYISWGDMDWPGASFETKSIWTALYGLDDHHLRVPCPEWETRHRIRGKRVKILNARRA